MATPFSRFSEKRSYTDSNTTGYDEYVEGVEAEETASLDTPISQNNIGFQLIQKMGWKDGTGLGKNEQGRKEPVPFELKDDNMGLGRWQMELDLAQDATEKRKLMESEKELTPDLLDKYKAHVAKEMKIAEATAGLRESYFCDLCDKQYKLYSEYDNHLNSYDHHHRQRLKDLRQYETGRKFGGHKLTQEFKQEKKDKKHAAKEVARERASMVARRRAMGNTSPGFKPIGASSSASRGFGTTPTSLSVGGLKTHPKSGNAGLVEKKARLEKYGRKFQSAGVLHTVQEGGVVSAPASSASEMHSEDRLSFAFARVSSAPVRLAAAQASGPEEPDCSAAPSAPPPLMSKSRKQTLARAFLEEEEEAELVQLPVRGPPKFKFKMKSS